MPRTKLPAIAALAAASLALGLSLLYGCTGKSGSSSSSSASVSPVTSSATPGVSVPAAPVPSGAAAVSAADLVEAGAAAVRITPTNLQGLALAGYGGLVTGFQFRWATGVMDDLWARTIYLEKDGTPFVLQSIDCVGMLHIDINPVKRRVEKELKIPFANVVVSSTHDHASPDPVGIWSGNVDEPYWATVRDRMFESIKLAYQARRPARVKSTSAEPISGYDPATHELKRGAAVRTADWLDAHEAGVAAGTHDKFLYQTDLRDPVVRATEFVAMQLEDAASGKTIATLVNWHDHPEVMGDQNTLITSDFPHFLRERVEAKLGGICVYMSGAVGCQIGALHGTKIPERDAAGNQLWDPSVTGPGGAPFPKLVSSSSVTKIRSIGYGIADEAVAALASATFTSKPRLAVKTEPLYVDFENPQFQLLTAVLNRFRSPFLNPKPEDLPIKGLPGFVSSVGVVSVNVTVATVGDVQLVTAPGEMAPEYMFGRHASVADYGSHGKWTFPAMPAIRAYMTGRDKMIAGLANSYLGYLIPRTDTLPLWMMSHPNFYEELVSSGPNFGDNVGNKILQMLGSPVRFSTYPTRP